MTIIKHRVDHSTPVSAGDWPKPGTAAYPGYGPDSVFGFEIDDACYEVISHAAKTGRKPEETGMWRPEWSERTPGQLYVFSDAHACHRWAKSERRGCASADRLPIGWTAAEARSVQ